jgi:hypothetical protein
VDVERIMVKILGIMGVIIWSYTIVLLASTIRKYSQEDDRLEKYGLYLVIVICVIEIVLSICIAI